jgi:hydrogenase nickel incorporation protein HypA/HybF
VHEASIALAIVDEVSQRAKGAGITRVHTVFVQVGALTSVVPDALRFAWDVVTEGTVAAGSRIEIEHTPLAIVCAPCDAERTIEMGTLPICPVCGTSSSAIVSGRELLVTAMEVADDLAPVGRSAEHSAQEHHAGR